MNDPKNKLVGFAVNYPRTVMAIVAIITIALAIPIPFAKIDTDPENMLTQDEPVRVTHSRIKDEFNLSDYLVVGFAGETNVLTDDFSRRLELLVEKIEEMEGVVAEDIMAPSTVDDIYRTPDGSLVVGRLTDQRTGWDTQPSVAEKIAENPILRGKLAAVDGRVVALYIPLESKKYAHEVSENIKAAMAEIGGFTNYHITGLPVAQETFGKEMFKQMGLSAPLAGLLIFLLLLFFFRKLKVILAPMILAVVTIIWTMGLLILMGYTVHIMSSMIPIFLMPIAVLNSIHILSEFHERYQKSKSQRQAISSTMDTLFGPMIFTTLTTVVGFASLMSASIPPVKVFGAFVAFGVGVAWLLSVTFNPAYAVLLSKRTLSTFGRMDEKQSFMGRIMPSVGRFALRGRWPILLVTVITLVVSAYGISRIVVNDNPTKWFKKSHPIRVAEQELGRHLAGTYMAYLEFDATNTPDESVKNPETLHYMEGLQKRLALLPQVGSTTGITDIVKKVRFELNNGDSATYAVPNSADEISQELFLYEVAGGDPEDLYKFITPDGDKAVMWIQLRDGDNMAVEEVVAAAQQYFAQKAAPAGMTFDWGGLTYINVIWQEKMVMGMRNALLGSFVVVSLMMIFLLRSVVLGLISMVPLTVTIALVYGVVGLTGKAYDMPIAILSSLTLGLSIDFAIHFLKRGQAIYKKVENLKLTMDELFEEPARAIARNIVVIALGFIPLLFSDLVPYVTVGVFFLAIMAFSGLATFLLLPGLASFRGQRVFWPWGARVETWEERPVIDEETPDQSTKGDGAMKQALAVLIAASVTIGAGIALAQDQPAVQMMNESHNAYYYAGDGGQAQVSMVLTNKKGRTREREFWMLRRDIADMGDQRYYTYFIKPADVSRTAFLVHKNAQGNDDRWLYVPSLDLVKRIAADDRRSSFVGSDFTYEDVSGRLPFLDNHEILAADTALGRQATKVKSTPKDAGTAEYQYRITWIDNETRLPLREDYFDKNNAVVRRFTIDKIETIEGIPTASQRTIHDLDKGSSTTISFTNITYKTEMKPDDFNERLLKNPPSAYTR